uniref:Uncharacterized protein n=1 Tax=Lepeophtheirus salmonis TaxID=72036 RepID=A0A0K2SZ78_LEPSM
MRGAADILLQDTPYSKVHGVTIRAEERPHRGRPEVSYI